MTTSNWNDQNEAFLRDSIAWLHLRLERQMALQQGASPAVVQPIQEHLAEAAAIVASDEQENATNPPALVAIAQRLGLSKFERDILLLCAALELDEHTAALCAGAHDDARQTYPTFGLALAMFDEPTWGALAPTGGLRFWRLVEITQPAGQPLATSPLRADERIVSYLKGLSYVDDRLAPFVAAVDLTEDQGLLAPSQHACVAEVVRYWHGPTDGTSVPVVQLVGPDSLSQLVVAYHAAGQLDLRLHRMDTNFLPQSAADLESLALLWRREGILSPVALFVQAEDLQADGAEARAHAVVRFLTRGAGMFALGVRSIWSGVGSAHFAVDVAKPTVNERRHAWETALGPVADGLPARLASQFELDLPTIASISHTARSEAADNAQVVSEEVWDACRASTRPRLDTLAQRVPARATWDDIVLPPPEMGLLRQIVAQAEQRTQVYEDWGFGEKLSRGRGIGALFSGVSGVGKSMAAEVIANALRLDLYRIDLSAVVSKYIGETEKNLSRLFDAADDGGVVLFFDEADALFGKRSEVRDSHDRYANIEINYLLQRMETYRGLAILATNMKSALDPAFVRRLRFIINFPFPDISQRTLIWEKVFPEATKKEELDFARLARLPATGAMIFNVALNAAFTAASAGKPVSMEFVLNAARAEFAKNEQAVPERAFAVAP